MRTTNQKSCSHGFYILQIFLRNPRGRSDPPQAENPVKQDPFLKSYYAPFFLYTILIQENISLHYLFIIKDIMMIRSKGHKII